jgi:hypothetical protein
LEQAASFLRQRLDLQSPQKDARRRVEIGGFRTFAGAWAGFRDRLTMLGWNYAAQVLLFPNRATFAFLADFVATNPVSVGALLPELSTDVVRISR